MFRLRGHKVTITAIRRALRILKALDLYREPTYKDLPYLVEREVKRLCRSLGLDKETTQKALLEAKRLLPRLPREAFQGRRPTTVASAVAYMATREVARKKRGIELSMARASRALGSSLSALRQCVLKLSLAVS